MNNREWVPCWLGIDNLRETTAHAAVVLSKVKLTHHSQKGQGERQFLVQGNHERGYGCACCAHYDEQATDSDRVREGLKDVLLGRTQLYEALREKAGQQGRDPST